jgi:hypothetical protein
MAMGPKFSPVYDVVTNGTRVECMIAEDMARIAAE